MKKSKIHSSLTDPASGYDLPGAQYFPRGIPQENFFPKPSIYVGRKFNIVWKLGRNFWFM